MTVPSFIFLIMSIIKPIIFNVVQIIQQQQGSFNSSSYSHKNINGHGNQSPAEDKDIIIIGPTTEISTSFTNWNKYSNSTKNHFSETKTDHNWKSHGQNNSYYCQPQSSTDLLYYQPQPTKYNQCQQYLQDRITQQA